jgi:hypothetical protein
VTAVQRTSTVDQPAGVRGTRPTGHSGTAAGQAPCPPGPDPIHPPSASCAVLQLPSTFHIAVVVLSLHSLQSTRRHTVVLRGSAAHQSLGWDPATTTNENDNNEHEGRSLFRAALALHRLEPQRHFPSLVSPRWRQRTQRGRGPPPPGPYPHRELRKSQSSSCCS